MDRLAEHEEERAHIATLACGGVEVEILHVFVVIKTIVEPLRAVVYRGIDGAELHTQAKSLVSLLECASDGYLFGLSVVLAAYFYRLFHHVLSFLAVSDVEQKREMRWMDLRLRHVLPATKLRNPCESAKGAQAKTNYFNGFVILFGCYDLTMGWMEKPKW